MGGDGEVMQEKKKGESGRKANVDDRQGSERQKQKKEEVDNKSKKLLEQVGKKQRVLSS